METNTIEYEKAKNIISNSIANCEKIQPKFAVGTSQHSLLKNRIQALYVAKALLEQAEGIQTDNTRSVLFTTKVLHQAIAPLQSIQHKCEKAQSKYEEGTRQYQRYVGMIQTMKLVLAFLQAQLFI